MTRPGSNRVFSSAAALALLLAGPVASASSLSILVRHSYGGQPLLLDSLRYENGARETLSVTRLSYLLSGFALETENGKFVELPGQYGWMDAARRRTFLRLNDVPPGKYRSLRFYVGLDAADNAADPAKFPADHPLNPNLNGLHWSWQGGYIFLALEGMYRDGPGELRGYVLHLARDPNRTRVTLAAPLDLTEDAGVQLDFDIEELLNVPRPLSFAEDGESTHSRDKDPVAAALAANLPGAFHVYHVEGAKPAEAPQPAVKPLYMPATYTPYQFKMSGLFPLPDLPRDNPLIQERVDLGRKLFHEPALSKNNSVSCASCHKRDDAFADSRQFSLGADGKPGKRHAPSLLNMAWKTDFFWDGRSPTLRAQSLVPIQDHAEMDETTAHVAAKLSDRPEYPGLFNAAFGSPKITPEKIGLALEQFVLTLTSYDSKFDRAIRGGESLTPQEQRGFELFMTEYDPRTGQYGADCFHCHGGALFTDHQFHNNGLASTGDEGRFDVTQAESDREKFATPSLRNVALTGPYMHDGRFATLDEVIEHYNSGVKRSATLDPNLAKHPDDGLHLSAGDKKALVAFLNALTDERMTGGPPPRRPPPPPRRPVEE